MAEVLDWGRTDNVAGFTRFAAQALWRGYVVAFPTETGYAACACALRDEAMARLLDVGDRPIELASTAETVRDWLPKLNSIGRRLAKRFWPGPLTLACSEGLAEGMASRLRPGIEDAIHPDGVLHLRHPGHDALRLAAGWLSGPLAMRPIPTDQGDALTARQALSSAGERFNLLIDDGTCRYAQPTTVVELKGDGWRVARAGVVSEELVRQQLARLIVFVCTGNTCRSPMAEAICKKVLAERLKCTVDELPARGYRIVSAGMAAAPGMPAADEAVGVAQSLGADLSQHSSRPLTAELAAQADHLFVMTQGHLRSLLGHLGEATNADLLSPEGEDVDDPIGQSREVYERCARQMQAYVEARVAALTG
jgi:protein-tyrosine-phosphatase/tRNA A37 threonylcarbamoyladenosine synthetase subunit TsaC/SUA5/YrdC